MWFIIPLAIIAINTLCGIVVRNISEKKGYYGVRWFWAGFVFGVAGIIYAAIRPHEVSDI